MPVRRDNKYLNAPDTMFHRVNKLLYILLYSLTAFSVLLTPTNLLAVTVPAGDVAPYGSPDGQVNVADVLILQRFVMDDLIPTTEELLVGDVAPFGSPDGFLNAADVAVLMRAILGEITLLPVEDLIPPPPPNTSLITISNPVSGNVTVTGEAGSVEGSTIVTLLNYETGEMAIVSANTDGSFLANIGGALDQVLSIIVMDSSGNYSLSTSAGVGDILTLTITSPINDASIDDDAVLVTGTFSGPLGTAILVNGQSACIMGNTFYAENVRLESGANTLEVTASIADGLTLTQTVDVTSTGALPIQVRADSACGYMTHTTDFTIANNTTNIITTIQADFDGDTVIDITTSDPTAIQYTYPATGVYPASITVQDNLGGSYTSQQTIIVNAVADMDMRLRGIYNNMRDRLRVGAIDGALNFVSGGVREKYNSVFTTLQANLPILVDQLGALNSGPIGSDIAEYIVIRDVGGSKKAFLIYFMKGEDGVWRIDGM